MSGRMSWPIVRNPTSRALLQQCATWLAAIDAISTADGPDENSAYWAKVSDLDAFRKSLGQLLLRSSRAEPTLAANYLQRVTGSKRIRDEVFQDIITFSPILAQSLPQSLVELSLAYSCERSFRTIRLLARDRNNMMRLSGAKQLWPSRRPSARVKMKWCFQGCYL